MKHLFSAILLITLLSYFAVQAQVPQTISYQGVLTNSEGALVPDGNYTIVFGLYNVGAAGTALWAETHSITITDGIFNAVLGSVNLLNLPFNEQYWLGIKIGTSAELAPRIEFSSSAYSLVTRSVLGDSNSFPSSGNVGIGLAEPADEMLQVAGTIHSMNGGFRFPDGSIQITAADTSSEINTGDLADNAVTTLKIANNAVTAQKISPNIISSLDGVNNDGGNIDLVAGSNITISPNDGNNTITIAASSSGNTLDQAYDQGGAGAGRIINASNGAFQVDGIDGALFTGSENLGSIPAEGGGVRTMWYPRRAAFRAGRVSGLQWNADSIGYYSFATGNNTIARANYSVAMGASTRAIGSASTAFGWFTEATGNYSTAIGYTTRAAGIASIAFGYGTEATGNYSTAIGYESEATGNYSVSLGRNSASTGLYAVALGHLSVASSQSAFATNGASATGLYSISMGNSSLASNVHSTAIGEDNTSDGARATAIGSGNHASGDYSTALGNQTDASGDYSTATGYNTTASGSYSTAMGRSTTASGYTSTTMGLSTTASGYYSTAMGSYVSTSGNGSMVLGDNSTTTVMSNTTANLLKARFANGYYLFTSSAVNIGVALTAGANSWAILSDSTKKENFKNVNGEEVLDKISNFKLTSWNYKSQDKTIFRHYGPMAQDFYNAFGNDGVGTIGNDTTISSADFDGINLIAIQALEKRTQEIEQIRNDFNALREENAQLKQQLKVLIADYQMRSKTGQQVLFTNNQKK